MEAPVKKDRLETKVSWVLKAPMVSRVRSVYRVTRALQVMTARLALMASQEFRVQWDLADPRVTIGVLECLSQWPTRRIEEVKN